MPPRGRSTPGSPRTGSHNSWIEKKSWKGGKDGGPDLSEVTHQAPSISHRPEQSQNDFKRFYKYIYYKIWIEEKPVWRIPCGINVVGLSFFPPFLCCCCCCYFIHRHSHPVFDEQTQLLFFFSIFFNPPAPNAEVQKLWHHSFCVADAVSGAP